MSGGNYNVILCERGIRTFETYTRNTLDIAAIPVIKKLSHLPILADPSHGTGRRDKVPPMARAAVAAGADGLLIEVHNDPEHALSDGAQSFYFEQFEQLMAELRMIAPGGRPQHRLRDGSARSRALRWWAPGLIGGSFALAARRRYWPGARRFVGWDKPDVLERALGIGRGR